MNRPCLLSASIFCALVAPAFADEANLQPEVVVTASRVARTADTTLADVSVITREDIDASATHDISDLLRLQAGIDVARTGGPGGQTSIFLRGTNNNHVLVLIDGIRVAALGTGVFTWETLPLDTIERIEIVRGPRASYWGSDAIGGVVQIFTRKLDAPRVSLATHYGDVSANVGMASVANVAASASSSARATMKDFRARTKMVLPTRQRTTASTTGTSVPKATCASARRRCRRTSCAATAQPSFPAGSPISCSRRSRSRSTVSLARTGSTM